MPVRPSLAILTGAVFVAGIGGFAAERGDTEFAEALAAKASAAITMAGGEDVTASFRTAGGSPTRHALLSGGENLDEGTRASVAKAVKGIAGVGGVNWADGTIRAERGEIPITPMHCQEDVQDLLRARTVRFEESSAELQAASGELLDEVAAALRPCLGSIIAITGHTDQSGPEPGNIALSLDRARAVREALIQRGIPRDGLRARGVGSRSPVDGLDPADPANRRIEFTVVSTQPLTPTPVDTPSAR